MIGHITDLPSQFPPRLKSHLEKSRKITNSAAFAMARPDKIAKVIAALAATQKGEHTDYSKAARAFKCDRTSSISKRIRLLARSRKEANSFGIQSLTNTHERVLIDKINHLSQ